MQITISALSNIFLTGQAEEVIPLSVLENGEKYVNRTSYYE